MTQTARWAALTAAILLACGLFAAGCGSSSSGGKQVTPTMPHNLEIQNAHFETIDVLIDRREVGQVNPSSQGVFRVDEGDRAVTVRERGSTSQRFLGLFDFDSSVVRLDYDPTRRNLFVDNQAFDTIHVYIDQVEITEVPPGFELEWVVSPGLHDVHFRERGESGQTFAGNFDFPNDSTGPIRLIYTP